MVGVVGVAVPLSLFCQVRLIDKHVGEPSRHSRPVRDVGDVRSAGAGANDHLREETAKASSLFLFNIVIVLLTKPAITLNSDPRNLPAKRSHHLLSENAIGA